MRLPLTGWFISSFALSFLPVPDATVNAADHARDRVQAAAIVAGETVLLQARSTPGEFTISFADKKIVVKTSNPPRRITEIKAIQWMSSGLAAVVETEAEKSGERDYFWLTVFSLDGSTEATPLEEGHGCTIAKFLGKAPDFDVNGIVNSQGDSIHITLSKQERTKSGDTFTGYVYVNNCPVSPVVAGELFALAATHIEPRQPTLRVLAPK